VIEQTLERLRQELDLANAGRGEYVLFGSAVLYLHGLRDEVGDVDVFVSRGVWADWFQFDGDGWHVRTPRADDPALLELRVEGGVKIHAFYDWTIRDSDWIRMWDCFEQAETVPTAHLGTWQCAPLSLIRAHKVGAWKANPGSAIHEKHLKDVDAIDDYLARRAALSA
jgi:hypothetical protein